MPMINVRDIENNIWKRKAKKNKQTKTEKEKNKERAGTDGGQKL